MKTEKQKFRDILNEKLSTGKPFDILMCVEVMDEYFYNCKCNIEEVGSCQKWHCNNCDKVIFSTPNREKPTEEETNNAKLLAKLSYEKLELDKQVYRLNGLLKSAEKTNVSVTQQLEEVKKENKDAVELLKEGMAYSRSNIFNRKVTKFLQTPNSNG